MGHRNLLFQNQRRLSVKDGNEGAKNAREFDEIYIRAVSSGNAVQIARAKTAEQLKQSIGSALLRGTESAKETNSEFFNNNQ